VTHDELRALCAQAREPLAAYAHEAWAGWMLYLFSKSERNADGTLTLPAWAAERWARQMTTLYAYLPEKEKESDRAEADKMLEIVGAALPALLDENARLRAALEQYADRSNWVFRDSSHGPSSDRRDLWLYREHGYERAWRALQPDARAALDGEARDGR
jgi:hypothetical protein